MVRVLSLGALGVFLLVSGLSAFPAAADEKAGVIADPALEGLIRAALGGLPPEEALTADWMAQLRELRVFSVPIATLSGMEHAVNLEILALVDCGITDISPLAGLGSLVEVYLSANTISDISAAAGWTNAELVEIASNDLSDITPLGGLMKVRQLLLGDNSISDLSPLSGLAGGALRSLALGENLISDVTPLGALAGLESLNLAVNSISSLAPLFGIGASLTYLDAIRNQINTLSGLEALIGLEELWLNWNQISDLSPLANLPALWNLRLYSNLVSSLQPLVDGTVFTGPEYQHLDVAENPLAWEACAQQIPTLESRGVYVNHGVCAARKVTVPAVTGMTETAARAAVQAAELAVGTVTRVCSDTAAEDTVTGQTPAADTQLAVGGAVSLTVSDGPCPVTVPDVLGMSEDAARAAIAAAGLTVGSVLDECDDAPLNLVFRQSPQGGAQAARGSAVTITISAGPCPVEVPDVITLGPGEARAAITAAGLVPVDGGEECGDEVLAGDVMRQSPAPGALVDPGTTVTLVYSTGPCPVAVPNINGLTEAEAVAAITGAGLTAGQITRACDNDVPAGEAHRQYPAAGDLVAPGWPVGFHVSEGLCGVLVPNVTGMEASAARAALTAAGLTVGTVYDDCHSTVGAGAVIRQSPGAGGIVEAGTAISLTVSTGPCPVAVPNVAGLTEQEASGVLLAAGLSIGTKGEECADDFGLVPGTVLSQAPGPGAVVAPGTPVNIVILTGPCPDGCSKAQSVMACGGNRRRTVLGDAAVLFGVLLFLGAGGLTGRKRTGTK